MKNVNVRKLTLAGILIAVGIVDISRKAGRGNIDIVDIGRVGDDAVHGAQTQADRYGEAGGKNSKQDKDGHNTGMPCFSDLFFFLFEIVFSEIHGHIIAFGRP